jgi:hypothetical protein
MDNEGWIGLSHEEIKSKLAELDNDIKHLNQSVGKLNTSFREELEAVQVAVNGLAVMNKKLDTIIGYLQPPVTRPAVTCVGTLTVP